jgi:hypothetical protein
MKEKKEGKEGKQESKKEREREREGERERERIENSIWQLGGSGRCSMHVTNLSFIKEDDCLVS